jgi:hypothetical protein
MTAVFNLFIRCDSCEEGPLVGEQDTIPPSRTVARARLKLDGWVYTYFYDEDGNGRWKDICPGCRNPREDISGEAMDENEDWYYKQTGVLTSSGSYPKRCQDETDS